MKTIIRSIIIIIVLVPEAISAQGVWTRKADYIGGRRFEFIGYSLNNKAYIGTGTYGGLYSFLGDWQEFDPALNTWTQKATLPMRFRGGAGFAAGGYGYATNGANDATFIFDTYEYNTAGDNWSSKATFDMVRLKATGVGIGNFGYILCGYDMMTSPMNDCWEYNQPANIWSQRASLPISASRYYATGFAVNGKVYIFGGTDGNTMLSDLWEFDPANNSWIQKTSLPGEGRQQSMAFTLGNEAYIIGGYPSSMVPLKECWKYNVTTNLWIRLADFPGTTGPAGGPGFTINGLGYVVCGNGTPECWEYTPEMTGISDLGTTSTIEIYPNPATEKIILKMPIGIKAKSTTIFDFSGKIIQQETKLSNPEDGIDIFNFQPGFYFVSVRTYSGTTLNASFIKAIN